MLIPDQARSLRPRESNQNWLTTADKAVPIRYTARREKYSNVLRTRIVIEGQVRILVFLFRCSYPAGKIW